MTGRAAFLLPGSLDSNSGYHVQGLTRALSSEGTHCTVYSLGTEDGRSAVTEVQDSTVCHRDLDWAALCAHAVDSEPVDVLHLWTTRPAGVRLMSLLRAHSPLQPPLVVHLEDDEVAVAAEFTGAAESELASLSIGDFTQRYGTAWPHPRWHHRILRLADGITSLTAAALGDACVPSAILTPGFDDSLFIPLGHENRARLRAEAGLGPDDIAVVYTGNVHAPVAADFASLADAVRLLRRSGLPVTLLSCGVVSDERLTESLGGRPDPAWRQLGWLPRTGVRDLMAMADIAVQPGRPSDYNRSRYPSKLPELLALGVPTVVSTTFEPAAAMVAAGAAIGLEEHSSIGIATALRRALESPCNLEALRPRAVAFARERLRWEAAADSVATLYRAVAAPSSASLARYHA